MEAAMCLLKDASKISDLQTASLPPREKKTLIIFQFTNHVNSNEFGWQHIQAAGKVTLIHVYVPWTEQCHSLNNRLPLLSWQQTATILRKMD